MSNNKNCCCFCYAINTSSFLLFKEIRFLSVIKSVSPICIVYIKSITSHRENDSLFHRKNGSSGDYLKLKATTKVNTITKINTNRIKPE